MDDKKCHWCVLGRIKCPRCGGGGDPPKTKVLDLYEQSVSRCMRCLGVGTMTCPNCGGVGVVPSRMVLR